MQAQPQNTNSLNEAPKQPAHTQPSPTNQIGIPSYFEIKLNKASNFKNEGNDFFKAHNYAQARGKYQQALQLLQPVSFTGATQDECSRMVVLSATLLFNLGTCFFNENRWREAELMYNQTITINPNYVKALYKRAMCRLNTNQYEGAMQDIKQAHNLDKTNQDIRQNYEKIREKYNEQLRKDNQKRKELSSKIFNPGSLQRSQSKKDQQDKNKKDGEENSNKAWWLLPLLPLAAAALYQGVKYFRNN